MDFLAKNAEQIARYNKHLANKILSHVIETGDYRLDYTKCDDLNLYIDGMPVHDEIDPVAQAKAIFDKSYQEGHVNIIYGLGLGYLLNRFIKEVNDKILIYEPNIDILRITLGLFDFSEALANPKIIIVHDKFNLKAGIEAVNVKDDLFTVYFLPFHGYKYKEELQDFINDLTSIHGLISVGYKELARQSKNWGINSISNLSNIFNNNELEALRGKFQDKPAVIVSAGPSLLKSIDAIKKHRDKIVVISVGIALKTLLAHGIKPDFTTIIEANYCLFNIEGADISGINFVFPPEVNYRIYEEGDLYRSFNYYTENLFTSDWIQNFTGVDCSTYINRGTVSITAIWTAHIMGCNPIILTGQDLAYVDGKCYAGDSHFGLRCIVDQETGEIDFETPDFEKQRESVEKYYKTKDPEQIKRIMDGFIDQKRKEVMKVKGQNGELIPTSAGYALFVNHFQELIPEMEGIKLFNCSTGGAQLDGYENIEIEEVLEKFATEKINVEKTVAESINSYEKPCNMEQKLSFIDTNAAKLQEYVHLCNKGASFIKKFRQQYNRTKKITNDVKQICFKGLNVYYETIEKIYTKNRYIMSMSYDEFTTVEESLKEFDKSRSDEDLMAMVQNIENFFKIASAYGEMSAKILKEQKAKINESIAAKS
ncbi:MAG: 6-hydroxymethylpterin diphosphokinase MptE-like protein [bacterium]